jgi:hypothetical protein
MRLGFCALSQPSIWEVRRFFISVFRARSSSSQAGESVTRAAIVGRGGRLNRVGDLRADRQCEDLTLRPAA